MSYNAGVIKLDDEQIVSLLNINEAAIAEFIGVYGISNEYAAWVKNPVTGAVWISTANKKQRDIREKINALPFI
jgi:hypothetical protein